MKQLIIFPFNGNGLEALDCIGGQFALIGFADDTPEKQGKHASGFTVYPRDVCAKYPEAQVLAVPGSPTSFRERGKLIASLGLAAERFATVIHPSASVSPNARIGRNVLIMAGAVITGNAVIGDHVCILPNSVIHHDCRIGNYCLIGSNVTVAGYTVVEENCYIGSGSSIINNITIGNGTLVGMASNVIKDIPPASKVAGNPARQL
jgi:sugar O-acyltransferase (sialic acid O-acetyltransferase NeuD family)